MIVLSDEKLGALFTGLPEDMARDARRVYELLEAADPCSHTTIGQALCMQQLDEARHLVVSLLKRGGGPGLPAMTLRLGLLSIEGVMRYAQQNRGERS